MPTRLRLFGRPAVIHAGSTIELPAERRSQLLVVLARRRAWVSRGELASLLWPGHAGALALTNVRKALHGARAWPWANALEVQGSALRLDIATDVHDFELALQEGRLADAVACCGGALLDGLDDLTNEAWTEWLDGERADHARRWHGLTRARLTQLQSKPEDAIVFARQLLATDPLDEDAVVSLLNALVAAGRLGERREVYRAYAERLADELGVEPSLRVRQLVRDTGSVPAVPWVPALVKHELHGTADLAHVAGTTGPGSTPWSDGFVGRRRDRSAVAVMQTFAQQRQHPSIVRETTCRASAPKV